MFIFSACKLNKKCSLTKTQATSQGTSLLHNQYGNKSIWMCCFTVYIWSLNEKQIPLESQMIDNIMMFLLHTSEINVKWQIEVIVKMVCIDSELKWERTIKEYAYKAKWLFITRHFTVLPCIHFTPKVHRANANNMQMPKIFNCILL